MTTPPEQPSEAITPEMLAAGKQHFSTDTIPGLGGKLTAAFVSMQRAATPAPVHAELVERAIHILEYPDEVDIATGIAPMNADDRDTILRALRSRSERLATDTALVEALRSAPIPGLKEPMRAFRKRSDEWLNTTYRKALASRGGSGSAE